MNGFVGTGCPDIGQFFRTAYIDAEVFAAISFTNDHFFINGCNWLDKKLASVFKAVKSIGSGIATAVRYQSSGLSIANISLPFIPSEKAYIKGSLSFGASEKFRSEAD